MAKLSSIEQAKLQKIMADPVLWARAFVRVNNPETKKMEPWIARDYQEEMLRDTSTRIVYRLGRRCMAASTKVLDPTNGRLYTLEELHKRQHGIDVVSLNEENYSLTARKECISIYSGERDVYEVTLVGGRTITITNDHPLLSINGWKTLKTLKVDDYVAVPSHLDFFGDTPLDDNDIKLLAYMIGDGNCLKKNVRFSQAPDSKQCNEMREIVQHYGCELHHYECSGNPYDFIIRKKENRSNRMIKNNVKETLIKYGVYGHDANTKFVPKEIFSVPKEQVALFLSRLYSTDGWASSHVATGRNDTAVEIGYCSNSEELVRDVSHLLLRFGIDSQIRKKDNAWNVSIRDKNGILKFADEIGIYGKEEAVSRCVCAVLEKADIDPFLPFEVNKVIAKEIARQGYNKADIVRLWDKTHRQQQRFRLGKHKLQRSKVMLIADFLKMDKLKKQASDNILWKQISSIKALGKQPTYDLQVPQYNNFIANDIITHNCGKTETMIIGGLHKALTNNLFRILYVTPYENQVNLIFMRIREIIANSPLIKAQVVKMKNSPYTVEFANGSVILGFTTGASSGQGAASVRGQRSDWIYMDEIDYMADLDYSTVAAIAGERAEIGITASSTPTGKRGTFYRMCMDPSFGYHQHFHPSMHNPNWCQKMEDQFRAEFTDIQYEHEILAEFGTEEAGVFDKDKLDAAMRREYYLYNELTPTEQRALDESGRYPERIIYDETHPAPYNPFRCMGVDWDAYAAGSSILVLDFDMKTRCFKVMKRVEVPRGEYTLDNAVNWIIRINKIYNPAWIFCDRGYGGL